MDMSYFQMHMKLYLLGVDASIFFSIWRYCVNTCTRSGSGRSVLRVNHVSFFLLMTIAIRDVYIYIFEKYISFIKR
jgi:hypothetical protein